GYRLGPGQRRPLPGRVERDLLPGLQEIEALLALAVLARLLAVHVEAVGAATDLGGPHLDQMDQALLEPAIADVALHARHGLVGVGNDGEGVEALHDDLSPRWAGPEGGAVLAYSPGPRNGKMTGPC